MLTNQVKHHRQRIGKDPVRVMRYQPRSTQKIENTRKNGIQKNQSENTVLEITVFGHLKIEKCKYRQ